MLRLLMYRNQARKLRPISQTCECLFSISQATAFDFVSFIRLQLHVKPYIHFIVLFLFEIGIQQHYGVIIFLLTDL